MHKHIAVAFVLPKDRTQRMQGSEMLCGKESF